MYFKGFEMSIELELTKSQIENLKNGIKTFLFPIDLKWYIDTEKNIATYRDEYDSLRWQFINNLLPIKKGDKNIIVKSDNSINIGECINIKLCKVEDIKIVDWQELGTCLFNSKEFYNNFMNELGINRTHKNNDYIFIAEFK